jgi:hypothetical protein
VIPTALTSDRLGVVAVGDGSDGVDVIGEEVPGIAASRDNLVLCFEDRDGQPVGAQVRPEIFDRVEFWGIGRQPQERDVFGDAQIQGSMPAGAVQHENIMRALGDRPGYLDEMGVHGPGVGMGHDQRGGRPALRADGAEDVGPLVAGVARGARGRVARSAQTRVSVPCWPTRASS